MALLVSQSLSLTLAGRIVALVVVPGVLVAIAAVLRLLEKNHNKPAIRYTDLELYLAIVYPPNGGHSLAMLVYLQISKIVFHPIIF